MTRRIMLAGMILALTVSAETAGAQGYSVEYTYSPHQGTRGTTITISGSCSPDIHAEGAHWRSSRRVSGNEQPYEFELDLAVDDTTGEFAGMIVVPQDAPVDNYRVSLDCWETDQLFAGADGTFIVTQAATTTTSVSTTTTTIVVTPSTGGAPTNTTTTTTATSITGPPATTEPLTTTTDGFEPAGDTLATDDRDGGPGWLAASSLGLLGVAGAGSFAWARRRRAQS